MNSIICLALSSLLIGLLYIYMRQQFSAQDRKINDLTQLVASVATELQQQGIAPASPACCAPVFCPAPTMPFDFKRLPEKVTVSDDSDSESDSDEDETDNENDNENENGNGNDNELECENIKVERFEEVKKKQEPLLNSLQVEDLSIVLDLNEGTKTINLFEIEEVTKRNYEKWTVKELKELVIKEGGPGSLKTKKELIDFLEKK